VALASIYVDPTTGGFFRIDVHMLLTLIFHLGYSIAAYFAFRYYSDDRRWLRLTAFFDVFFATAVAFVTEGLNSPSFAFFLFAIIAAGCWADFRGTMIVTVSCVAAYLLVIALRGSALTNTYAMRAAYLGIAGYLIDFLGQQRTNFERRLHDLETAAERQKIARSLHDGYIQSLAGVNLRLETCRDMLVSEQTTEAIAEIADLQRLVDREYDEVRAYVRSLVSADPVLSTDNFQGFRTQFRVHADFTARGLIVEQVLLIALEGVRNTRRHGRARRAAIEVRQSESLIRIGIDDDGIGFGEPLTPPWTITSRVTEFGGRLRIRDSASAGAHLEIEMPDN
jgi:signal transduction histidine kinase